MTWSITDPAVGARYSRTPPASLETRAIRSVGPRRNSTLQMNSSMMAGPHRAQRATRASYIGFPVTRSTVDPFSVGGIAFRPPGGLLVDRVREAVTAAWALRGPRSYRPSFAPARRRRVPEPPPPSRTVSVEVPPIPTSPYGATVSTSGGSPAFAERVEGARRRLPREGRPRRGRTVISPLSYAPSEGRAVSDSRSIRMEVRVELKPGVMDAEAESIEKSLGLLGIGHVRQVTTARIYDLEFSGVRPADARRLTDEAVERLLANPVIHRVTVRPATP